MQIKVRQFDTNGRLRSIECLSQVHDLWRVYAGTGHRSANRAGGGPAAATSCRVLGGMQR
jgi:hypothetical protein